ncbi:CPS_collapsed_G0049210.mRNA.1.CDS.1 [Saccharomyces cerevisiae]|nr:CPS_collapsed_G0049210.mRNA.1.CDS.1 [Saccharomyces cerevisiae]
MKDAINMTLSISPEWLQRRVHEQYSFGYSKNEEELRKNELHHKHWSNPMEVPLPEAPPHENLLYIRGEQPN